WIVEVKKEKQNVFEKLLKDSNVPFDKIGETKGKNVVIKDNSATVVDIDVDILRKIWKNAIYDIMG
ncbi:MAG: hypothetical protein DRP09_21600, partial [Candidatus Thorarchaeota archaeon]